MTSINRIASFALLIVAACGRSATPPASAPAPVAKTNAAPAVAPALIAEGDSLFNTGACVRCHGARGVGGANGPSLVTGPWLQQQGSVDELTALIIAGVPRERLKDPTRRFAMNPRGGPMNLNDPQARALASYVWSISRDKR